MSDKVNNKRKSIVSIIEKLNSDAKYAQMLESSNDTFKRLLASKEEVLKINDKIQYETVFLPS